MAASSRTSIHMTKMMQMLYLATGTMISHFCTGLPSWESQLYGRPDVAECRQFDWLFVYCTAASSRPLTTHTTKLMQMLYLATGKVSSQFHSCVGVMMLLFPQCVLCPSLHLPGTAVAPCLLAARPHGQCQARWGYQTGGHSATVEMQVHSQHQFSCSGLCAGKQLMYP